MLPVATWVPTPSYAPLKRDEQSEECEAEEDGVSQKPQALKRASTYLAIINLSSGNLSESQFSPNFLRTIQKLHHRVV
ncbi:hypothetical protein BHYA_0093g00010 [Botrytis hyacinthi]|uniref:Uncharacterized protein n=1 Tax=Botrytis hyacinthi TaxID=278943 RepID=A0A4Z1GL21_9HELO|nr:hypothetical protein BHYA_0093g00010 [Botrytis hyacinthi]